jgi:hypothetical protein
VKEGFSVRPLYLDCADEQKSKRTGFLHSKGKSWFPTNRNGVVTMNEQNTSPIDVLWPEFADAPFSLAPERKVELQKLLVERKINFRLDSHSHEMRFEGQAMCGELGLVYVGLRGLERLWAHAYGAAYVYTRLQTQGFQQPLRLTDSDEGRVVAELLGWALQGEIQGDPAPWPAHLPRPKTNPTDDQNRLSNELFLGATGFAVLHEVGHIVKGHSGMDLPRDLSYRHEFEADEWAYDWVLDQWRDYQADERVFTKRATLIATLFALIAVPGIYRPRRVCDSKHPNPIDRLLRFLTKHANVDCGLPVGLAWRSASEILNLHLSQRLEECAPPFSNLQAFLNAIRDLLDDRR